MPSKEHWNGIALKDSQQRPKMVNSICERMHQAVGNSLRAMVAMQPPAAIDSANRLVDTALSNCLFATRAPDQWHLDAI